MRRSSSSSSSSSLTCFYFFIIAIISFSAPAQPNQDFGNAAAAQTLLQEGEHVHEVHCSRERSRAAWKIIDEYLMPFVEKEQYQISSKCRLHSVNDMFRDQEEHKIHVDINEWRCGYCKKSFRAEKFLDQHFDNRHYNLLNSEGDQRPVHASSATVFNCAEPHRRGHNTQSTVCLLQMDEDDFFNLICKCIQSKCLADLCGALHCDFVINSKSYKSKCNPAASARNRHLCESLADSCFPVNQGLSASRLHELFLHQFCDAHTCSGKKKPFPKGGKEERSIFYLAVSILTLMLLPIFYLIVYLSQREMRGKQELRRIKKTEKNTKPS